jgi:hypothetical protein
MKKDHQDTINKSLLLNWLYLADKNLPVEELNKWLTAKTGGRYTIVRTEISDNLCRS